MLPIAPQPPAAHPRSRGEHFNLRGDEHVVSGSSPLARGTQEEEVAATSAPRLIPARAGNTTQEAPQFHSGAAHPRSRGEHLTLFRRLSAGFGSSPLARGTLNYRARLAINIRLIPARAGNTSSRRTARSWTAAHPRSRGEHLVVVMDTAQECGSSPLARGTQGGINHGPRLVRLIPARAGNTTS